MFNANNAEICRILFLRDMRKIVQTILIIADNTTEIWITQSKWLGKEMIDIYIKNIAVNVSVYIIHIYL